MTYGIGVCAAMPPVCDTIALGTDAAEPSPLISSLMQDAEALAGRPVTLCDDGTALRGRDPGMDDDAKAVWRCRVGSVAGFGTFRYVLEGRGTWEDILVLAAPAEGGDEDRPIRKAWRWYLKIGSKRLWRGWQRGQMVVDIIRDLVKALGANSSELGMGTEDTDCGLWRAPPKLEAVRISRIDICRDMIGHHWTPEDFQRFVSRSPRWSKGQAQGQGKTDDHEWIDTPEGWVYGSRTGATFYKGRRRSESRFLRVYNKSIEAKASGKAPWLDPIHRHAFGCNREGPLLPVWRAEVEHGGAWCKAHGLDSAAKLDGIEEALWSHYVYGTKLIVRDHSRDKRCSTAPIWQMLQSIPWVPMTPWRYQPRPATEADCGVLRSQAIGCLVGIATRLHPLTSAEECTDAANVIIAETQAAMVERLVREASASIAKTIGITMIEVRTALEARLLTDTEGLRL